MRKPNPNDISVGKDKWITFIELDGQQTIAFELDEVLRPIEPFLNALETNCVAGCCGIDAYALWPDDIVSAAKLSVVADLPRAINDVRMRIVDADADSFVSYRMDNYFHKTTLLQLVDHIAENIRCVDD